MAKRRKMKTVTMKLNRDGSVTYRSTGGFDLRKLFPQTALEGLTASEKAAEPNGECQQQAGEA